MDNKKSIISALILTLTTVVVFFLIKGVAHIFPESTPSPTATVIQSQFPDFDIIKSLDTDAKFVHLINNASDRNDSEAQNQVGARSLSLTVHGKIARAYVYVEASVNNKPISKFESVYIKFNGLGGHLFRPNSLPAPALENATRLLYALNDVSYITPTAYVTYPVGYSDTKAFVKADWFSFLKDGLRVRFAGFFGSQIDGRIDMKLYYQCDPSTLDCSIVNQ